MALQSLGFDSSKERDRLDKRMQQLRQQRDKGWLQKWRDIRDNIAPDDGQFDEDPTNDGKPRDTKIHNPKPREALGTLRAGMTSGMTSPARPWFSLTAPDGVQVTSAVKTWLYQVQQSMAATLSRSNLYQILPQVYQAQGAYGQGVMSINEDDKEVVIFAHHPCGTYMLATNEKGQVDTLYRTLTMSVRAMAQQFGRDNLSASTKNMLENNPDEFVTLYQAVEPNAGYIPGNKLSKRYLSTYWEPNKDVNNGILERKGFTNFPFFAPRWDVNGSNVYGNGPGDVALGKCKQLQQREKRKMRLVDTGSNPSMVAPAALRGQRATTIPGDITYLSPDQNNQGFEPAYVPDHNFIAEVRHEIEADEAIIARIFFEDLFLMISNSDTTMTAYEVAQLKEEKMLMLGPVIERNNDELLDPLIDSTFAIMLERSLPAWMGLTDEVPLIPPPPEELQDTQLKVEYTSILATAQKLIATGSIERTVQFIGVMAQSGFTDALDKLNPDAAVDEYTNALGTPPTIIRSDDDVAAIRQQRAQQQQQLQQQEQAAAMVEGAKTLSQTSTGGDTALSAVTGALGGAQPGA